MKVHIDNPHPEKAYWIKWSVFRPFFERNTSHPLNPSSLIRAYHNLWFTNRTKKTFFIIGNIDYYEPEHCIYFSNGRNRTSLLSLYMDILPISLQNSIFESSELQRGIVGEIKKTETMTLPNLPIKTYAELTQNKQIYR